MSNPYDPNAGNNPYGSPDPSGAGAYGQGGGYGDPYGQQPNPYGEGPKKTDAVSIIGFILSLTCCLSVVGAILGFVGLSRTKGGKRKGRWAAIAAAIIGVLGTIIAVVGGVFLGIFINSAISIDEAKVGQCLNVDDGDDSDIFLQKKECDEEHDGEIVAVGKASDVAGSELQDLGADPSSGDISREICRAILSEDALAILDDTYDFGVASEDGNPSGNDKFICYVTLANDDKLSEKILP